MELYWHKRAEDKKRRQTEKRRKQITVHASRKSSGLKTFLLKLPTIHTSLAVFPSLLELHKT